MSNLCFQVEDYISPFAGQLPSVQTEDLIYIEKLETDAYGHWIFGGSSASLIDKVNKNTLTVQSGATIQPIYSEKYLTLSNKYGNALVSNLLDSTVNAFTLSAVVQASDLALTMFAGTLGASSNANGAGLFAANNKIYATARIGVSSLDAGLILVMSRPVFVSMSINKATLMVNLIAMQDGKLYQASGSLTSYVAAAEKLSFGNVRYNATGSVETSKYYEAIIHNKALTVDEMKAVAKRAKSRLTHNGIVF